MSEKLKYRPEIDGLRAVAVLAVILFHAGLAFFRGGFVGVDVFFVISGYLITSIILKEMSNQDFSLRRFYERRARRILPALFFLIGACLPLAWIFMNVLEQGSFYKSILAVSLFASNIYFWQENNYFAPDMDLSPLLHTWTLAVEEQYYLFFPFLLMLGWKWGRRKLFALLALLSLVSLGLSEWGAYNYAQANFYLLHSRLWEILTGSLVAFALSSDSLLKKRQALARYHDLLSLLGLGLILFSIFAFSEYPPFPNLFTLVPVLGAALIIVFADTPSLTARLLSHPAAVQIGLISYSAYLWHQPIFAFARISKLAREGDSTLFLGLGAVALVMGYLSWKYVEQPFRNKQKYSGTQIFKGALAGSLMLTGLAGAAYVYTEHARAVILDRTRANLGLSTCDQDIYSLPQACRTSANPDVLVWGDSFAMHLVDGILASEPGTRMLQVTRAACGPVLDLAAISPGRSEKWADECIASNRHVLDWLKKHPQIRYVVLGSIFQNYLEPENFIRFNRQTQKPDYDLLANQFRATLRQLEALGVQPVVFSPPPKNGEDLSKCIIRALYSSREQQEACHIKYSDYQAHYQGTIQLLKSIEKDYPVVWLEKGLCNTEQCLVQVNKVLMYRDDKHLSVEGSKYIGKKMNFAALIRSAGTREQP